MESRGCKGRATMIDPIDIQAKTKAPLISFKDNGLILTTVDNTVAVAELDSV